MLGDDAFQQVRFRRRLVVPIPSIAERGQVHRDDVEAVVEILAKGPGLDHRGQLVGALADRRLEAGSDQPVDVRAATIFFSCSSSHSLRHMPEA